MDTEHARQLRAQGKHEEARQVLVALAALHPQDAALNYETACVHDSLGLESEAVPYYRAALSGDLPPETRCSALVGLGSTYRTLGMFTESEQVLLTAKSEFPEAASVDVFLAMTHHNLGHSRQAVEALLRLLVKTSSDPGIQAYGRAISFYAQDIDRTWPPEDETTVRRLRRESKIDRLVQQQGPSGS